MRIGLCLTKTTKRGKYILDAFQTGVERWGDRTLYLGHERQSGICARCGKKEVDETIGGCDAIVQICTANKFHRDSRLGAFRHDVDKAVARHKVPQIIIDSGFIKNQSEAEQLKPQFKLKHSGTYEPFDAQIYYEVGVNGLKRNAEYFAENCLGDRWSRLEVRLDPWRQGGDYVLLIGQPLHGASTQHINVHNWYKEVVHNIRKHTGRFVLFRPHPRVLSHLPLKTKELTHLKTKVFNRDNRWHYSKSDSIYKDFVNAKCVVVFSSNAAVQATVFGIPVFGCDEICMAYPVSNQDFSKLEVPEMPDRQQWAYNLAYCQWNCAEMKSGECWGHLRQNFERK